MNVFKTFDIFLAQPLSIIRDRIIQICHVESDLFKSKNNIQFNISNESTQINIYNNPKMYNLLSSVLYKKKRLLNDNQKSEVHN